MDVSSLITHAIIVYSILTISPDMDVHVSSLITHHAIIVYSILTISLDTDLSSLIT